MKQIAGEHLKGGRQGRGPDTEKENRFDGRKIGPACIGRYLNLAASKEGWDANEI